MFGSIEPGDVEKRRRGSLENRRRLPPAQGIRPRNADSFNHGRSEQRVRWLTKGLGTGNPLGGDTFSPAYSAL